MPGDYVCALPAWASKFNALVTRGIRAVPRAAADLPVVHSIRPGSEIADAALPIGHAFLFAFVLIARLSSRVTHSVGPAVLTSLAGAIAGARAGSGIYVCATVLINRASTRAAILVLKPAVSAFALCGKGICDTVVIADICMNRRNVRMRDDEQQWQQ